MTFQNSSVQLQLEVEMSEELIPVWEELGVPEDDDAESDDLGHIDFDPDDEGEDADE